MPVARPLPLLLLVVAMSAPAADIVVRASRSGDVPPLIGTYLLRANVESMFRALVDEIERQQKISDQ